MAKEKISKHDEMVNSLRDKVAYIDTEKKVIGVYQDVDDMMFANKSKYIKKLKTKTFGYHIQMVIK